MIVAAAVAWVLLVFGGYYAIHKPITAEALAGIPSSLALLAQPWSAWSLLDTLFSVLLAGWIVLIGAALGLREIRWLGLGSSEGTADAARSKGKKPERRSATEAAVLSLDRVVIATALGLGTLALIVFVAAFAGLLYLEGFLLLVSFGTAVLLPQLRGLVGHLRPREGWRRLAALPPLERVLALYVLATLVLTFLTALTPPALWDALTYHLTVPRLILDQRRLLVDVDAMHFYFPQLGEMLFTVALALRSDIAAKLLHFAYLLLTVGAIFAFARRFLGSRVGWLAAAIFLTVPTVLILASEAYVDLALVAYSLLAFWALMEWLLGGRKDLETGEAAEPSTQSRRWLAQQEAKRRSENSPWLTLSAVMAGLAMGVKYTAVATPVALGLILLLQPGPWRHYPQPRTARLRDLLRWGLIAFAVGLPWYLKNFVVTGNPVYPFIWGGTRWDSFQAQWVSRFGSGLITEPWRLLIAPLEMTILGSDEGLIYQAAIGPVLLALLPVLLLVRRTRLVKLALVYCLVVYLIWLLGVAASSLLMQTRLLLPIFGLLAVLAAFALDRAAAIRLPSLHLQRFLMAALFLALGLGLVAQATRLASDSPLPVIVGAESWDRYLERHLKSYYALVNFTRHKLPAEANLYFMWEPRTYYIPQSSQPDVLLNNWRHLLYRYNNDLVAIRAALGRQGITHVVINRRGVDYYLREPNRELLPEHLTALAEFEARYLKRVYGSSLEMVTRDGQPGLDVKGDDWYSVYEVDYGG